MRIAKKNAVLILGGVAVGMLIMWGCYHGLQPAGPDATAAEATMDAAREISRQCDQIVEEIMATESTGDARNAVAVTMTVRYYKRVTAHLSNIASGVVNPVHKIDYYKPDEPGSDSWN